MLNVAVAGVMFSLLIVVGATYAAAATFTVSNTSDSGAGSLRQAILGANAAPGADEITFAHLHGTITLTSGQLDITDDLTIAGPGAKELAVSGNDSSRVFDVEGSTTSVTITGLTVTHGLANGSAPHGSLGGGIYHDGGRLRLTGVVLSNNRALGDPGTSPLDAVGLGAGGGIFNGSGHLEVTDSLLNNNQVQGGSDSSGIAVGGSIYNGNAGDLTVAHTTFDHNLALGGNRCSGFYAGAAEGGGILTDGTVTVTGSMFRFNRALGGNDNDGDPLAGFADGLSRIGVTT